MGKNWIQAATLPVGNGFIGTATATLPVGNGFIGTVLAPKLAGTAKAAQRATVQTLSVVENIYVLSSG